MRSRHHGASVCLVILLLSMFIVQCKKEIVNSTWAENPVTIDGQIDDWDSVLLYDENLDMSYGVQNDGEFLYLTLATANQMRQRQIMTSGMVLWLDENGGKMKSVGFKYPIGLLERQVPARDFMFALRNPTGEISDEQLQNYIKQMFRDLQIVNSKGENLGIYTHHKAKGHHIQFELKYTYGNLIYELGIPLQCSERHPWSFAEAEKIGIGLETPEIDFSQMGGRRPGGGPTMDASSGGGGMGGCGGGRGGGRGGGMPGGDMSGAMPTAGGMGGSAAVKPLKLWITAEMATE